MTREQVLARNAISRTKERLKEFEQKYGMKTEEFYERFKPSELGDSTIILTGLVSTNSSNI